MKYKIAIVFGIIALLGVGCSNNTTSSLVDKTDTDLSNDRCYQNENNKCLSNTEQEIVKLLPAGTILREMEPIPWLDRNEFIGIYIENPVIAQPQNDNYISCFGEKRGLTITGVYHLFTYSNEIDSDIIIPESTSFSDYNSSLSAQRISMAWKNTKYNNFNWFDGRPYKKDEEYNLQISNLINFKDYNGDGYPYEFVLFGGQYFTCSDDENLIAGYDKNTNSAIIYKVIDSAGKTTYWTSDFIPDKNGTVVDVWGCGDHGSDQEIKVTYNYSPIDKSYYFINRTVKQCY